MTHSKEQQYLNDLHSILPSLKIPEHIICIEEFPLIASGKLDERKIREIVLDKLSHTINPKIAIKAYKIQKKLRNQQSNTFVSILIKRTGANAFYSTKIKY